MFFCFRRHRPNQQPMVLVYLPVFFSSRSCMISLLLQPQSCMKNPPLPVPRTRKSTLATITKKIKLPTCLVRSPIIVFHGLHLPFPEIIENYFEVLHLQLYLSVITPYVATPAMSAETYKSTPTPIEGVELPNPPVLVEILEISCRPCSSHTRPLGESFYSVRNLDIKSTGSRPMTPQKLVDLESWRFGTI